MEAAAAESKDSVKLGVARLAEVRADGGVLPVLLPGGHLEVELRQL
jgi:hypothetical protein